MAKSPAAPAAVTYEAEAEYTVTLTRAIPFGSMLLRPQDDIRLKGKHLSQLKPDDVAAATRIA